MWKIKQNHECPNQLPGTCSKWLHSVRQTSECFPRVFGVEEHSGLRTRIHPVCSAVLLTEGRRVQLWHPEVHFAFAQWRLIQAASLWATHSHRVFKNPLKCCKRFRFTWRLNANGFIFAVVISQKPGKDEDPTLQLVSLGELKVTNTQSEGTE